MIDEYSIPENLIPKGYRWEVGNWAKQLYRANLIDVVTEECQAHAYGTTPYRAVISAIERIES